MTRARRIREQWRRDGNADAGSALATPRAALSGNRQWVFVGQLPAPIGALALAFGAVPFVLVCVLWPEQVISMLASSQNATETGDPWLAATPRHGIGGVVALGLVLLVNRFRFSVPRSASSDPTCIRLV